MCNFDQRNDCVGTGKERFMKFTEKLLKHPEFLRLQKRVQQIEQDRIYCHHELSHALDVCRMAWMMYLEDQMQEKFESGLETDLKNNYESETGLKKKDESKSISESSEWIAEDRNAECTEDICGKKHCSVNLQEKKDQFYVTGLLHDIGRVAQYETGEHHSEAGMRVAEQLLSEIGYPAEWMAETLQIVGVHHGREEEKEETGVMEYYIRRADHLSRNCFLCEAADSCKWSDEERNQTIIW